MYQCQKISTEAIEKAGKIIQEFIASGFAHMPFNSIPNNRVFVSDISTSYLAYAKDNVVIEHYLLHPNTPKITAHGHPFANQMIVLAGKLNVYRKDAFIEVSSTVENTSNYKLSSITFPPFMHGFQVGDIGAVVYNIQIWNDTVTNPTSATVEYYGEALGPVHALNLEQK
ncbi:MAG: hypothetical protein ACK5S6_05640 [bacterium]